MAFMRTSLRPKRYIFQKESCYREFREKTYSPKQMPWELSKIKDFDKLLPRKDKS
jgi:hypothetical protein